jgi:hypothetical protein
MKRKLLMAMSVILPFGTAIFGSGSLKAEAECSAPVVVSDQKNRLFSMSDCKVGGGICIIVRCPIAISLG